MNSIADVSTLVHLLRSRAETEPDKSSYILLADNPAGDICLTYRQLDQQARTIGARLQGLQAAGERVLLLFPTSAEYITAFFGCLYAGAIPVPLYPPRRNRPDSRIQAVAADSQATIALTTPFILAEYQKQVTHTPELESVRFLALSYPEPLDGTHDWVAPALRSDSLAYIQYTSGSTASPKGVILSHGNLLHNLAQIQEGFDPDPEGTAVSWLPLYHDMGLIGCALMVLYAGKPLALFSPVDFAQNPLRWLQTITRYRATESGGPTFAYQWCIDRITPEERATLRLDSWKKAFCGAEPVDANVLDRFSETFAPCGFRPEAFYPSYGLAEATLAVSIKAGSAAPAIYNVQRPAPQDGPAGEKQTNSGHRLVSCGPALPGQRVEIVDPESLTPCPPGSVGEIWVSGPTVGQGYWNRPAETERTFRAVLPGTEKGPFLRTGDLGFFHDGELFIAGRLKDVIIVHGLNYDPRDIEQSAQQSHPALQPGGGAAFSVPAGGEERLVIVHELRRSHRKADTAEIARAIRHAVGEEHELPIHLVCLVKPGGVPRTSSGKIQRYLCREQLMAGRLETIAVSPLEEPLSTGQDSPRGPVTPPRTPLEAALAAIWAEVLGLEQMDVEANFFELGGDSLKATQVISRLREAMHAELPLRDLFETPTVAGLAALLERETDPPPALSIPAIEPLGRQKPLPLSFAQERLWFLHQLNPESSAYNVPGALYIHGPVDRQALDRSLQAIVQRHEAFRTTFVVVDGRPFQAIAPSAEVPLQVVDLGRFPEGERQSRAAAFIREEARRPFDLVRGPLLRASLVQLAGEEHILLFNMHHIVSDAWSLGLLTGEVGTLYNAYARGTAPDLPALPIQYADFAVWQKQWLQGQALETQLAYWRQHLDGVPVLQLPTDYPRPAVQTYRGAIECEAIPAEFLVGLENVSKREEVTLFMTLLAAFQILLCRYTGQEDIAICIPVANRNWLAVEGVVGSFVNTLVVRTDLSGDITVRDLLDRVREASLGAFTHQDMPYAKLVAELQPDRDTSHSPLAQVMFNVINVAMPSLQLDNLDVTTYDVDRSGAQFDLTLTIVNTDLAHEISIEYSTDLFAAGTVRRLLHHFRTLLVGIMADPEQKLSSLPMLDAAEREELVVDWNETRMDYPEDATLVRLFETQAERTPGAPAFVHDGQSLSYGELNRRANQLARHLQSLGVGPGVTVGVFLERSLDMPPGLLGILKAGGAYLPLDPSHPQERLAFMLSDAGAAVILTNTCLVGRLPLHEALVVRLDADGAILAGQDADNLAGTLDACSPPYVLYTSGSTGKPKGVVGTHRGAVNRFAWMWHAFPFRQGEVCCQKTPLTFVDSVWELFGPLLQSIPAVILPDGTVRDPRLLVQSLAENRVTRIVLVPSLLKAILDTYQDLAGRLPDLWFWVCSGEPLPVELVLRFRQAMPGRTLLNLYGCSEVAADSTCFDTADMDPGSPVVPIGRPIANTQVYLLDGHGNPVPIGVPGEIYVGGAGLARGYINNPELTGQRFIPDLFSTDPAARLYRTGDLGRYRPDGNIEYLGRRDHQVQIRGFRVELAEIEVVLRQHPGIAQATVISFEDGGDTTGSQACPLVACVVAAEGAEPSAKELRTWLAAKLPSYMIPAAFLFLDAMPLNPHGKLDRQALARLAETSRQGQGEPEAPPDGVEGQLVQIWEEVLGIRPIGVQDNFFDLGGHSLLAIRLFARIQQLLGVEVPIASLFQAPTIEQLAALMPRAEELPARSLLIPIQPEGAQRPFFCVHGLGGGVLGYRELARLLGPDQPFYGLQAKGLVGEDPPQDRVEEMAAEYLRAVRLVQPSGPYSLGGYSMGGVVAFEMACQLVAQGEKVALLALFDAYAPIVPGAAKPPWHSLVLGFVGNLRYWLTDFFRRRGSTRRLRARFRTQLREGWRRLTRASTTRLPHARGLYTLRDLAGIPEEYRRVLVVHDQAMERYRPQRYPGRLTLFRVRAMRLFHAADPELGWGKLADGGVAIRIIPGAHYNLLREPHVTGLAEQLGESLARADDSRQDPGR